MANQEQIARLRNSVEEWNTWRKNNPAIHPNLRGANLSDANLNGADLNGADLNGADLIRTSLRGASLNGADLRGASLNGADLIRTHLRETDLIRTHLIGTHLNGADLRGASLSGANLSDAQLSDANLSDANLMDAHLMDAHLSRANLSRANLSRANLSRANLSRADLSEAKLGGADLSGADLSGADLSGATIRNTSFGDQDLRVVKGLETTRHKGPSPLSINTIYLSQGDIPEAFVRGTGVPDSFLEYMKALASKPIEYYSCFISYSSHDAAFAKRLYDNLQGQNVRCWFAPHDMRIGDEIRSQIDESIRIHDKLLLVLSQHSIESMWVKKEVETAFEKEQQHGKLVLFPVKLDDTVMQTEKAWAADIRRMRHIGDFQRWKEHDEYQQSFIRLLRDLKADSNR